MRGGGVGAALKTLEYRTGGGEGGESGGAAGARWLGALQTLHSKAKQQARRG